MTSLNNHSSAGHTAAYLKLPIVLTNAAWLCGFRSIVTGRFGRS